MSSIKSKFLLKPGQVWADEIDLALMYQYPPIGSNYVSSRPQLDIFPFVQPLGHYSSGIYSSPAPVQAELGQKSLKMTPNKQKNLKGRKNY